MSINKDWDRWIKASVNTYLYNQIKLLIPTTVPIFLEDGDRKGAQDWVEIRMDGPLYEPLGSKEWRLTIEINILVTSLINEEPIYRIRGITGSILQILSGNDIPVIQYPEDPNGAVGCLQTKDIATHYYEHADADTPMRQATIDCFAEINLIGA